MLMIKKPHPTPLNINKNHTPYKAIITDLDGTLLNGEHVIGEYTISVLQALDTMGVDIYFATGRNYPDVARIVDKINLNNATMVTSNGARADYLSTDSLAINQTSTKILQHTIAEPIIRQILDDYLANGFDGRFDDKEMVINTYQGDDWFINSTTLRWEQYFKDSGYMYNVTNFENYTSNNTEKLFFIAKNMDTPEVLAPIEAYMHNKYADVLQMTHSMPHCFELMAKGINKCCTLAEILAIRDYGFNDCIAFGDGMNDIEMLLNAGKSCIMKNANDKVKKALPHLEIIGNHKNESVAKYIATLFNTK